MFSVTEEWLNSNRTKNGGFTKKQAAALGEEWPLASGWLKRAVGKQIAEAIRREFEAPESKKSGRKKRLEKRLEASVVEALRQQQVAAQERVEHVIRKASIDPAGDAFLQSFEWRAARMMAIKRYGPVCQCCGASPKTGAVINVDHIKPRKLFPELALSQDNLQILCNDCNAGKGNWDQTDWRAAA